jgi:hypothetical protein
MMSIYWIPLAFVVSLAALTSGSAAQERAFTRPATETEEIALALSAAPASLRAGAGVHVMTATGYRKVRDTQNGLTCLVEQSRPDTQEPICWDPEGTATIMPAVLAAAEWRCAGADAATVERRVNEGFASGRFRPPSRAGVAYMMSAENYVFNGQSVIHYHPHVMVYAPYVTNAMIGADMKDPYQPWVLNEGSPHAYIIVVPGGPH